MLMMHLSNRLLQVHASVKLQIRLLSMLSHSILSKHVPKISLQKHSSARLQNRLVSKSVHTILFKQTSKLSLQKQSSARLQIERLLISSQKAAVLEGYCEIA